MSPGLACFLATALGVLAAGAQEMVTVPRARLQELERKEAELEQLKRAQSPGVAPAGPVLSRSVTTNSAVHEPPSTLVGGRVTNPPPTQPDAAALAAYVSGQVVTAAQLWQQYQADPKAAAARFERARIRVAGEVVALDKPAFVRHAIVYLAVDQERGRLAARVEPSAATQNLLLTSERAELAEANSRGARTSLARIGQRVVLEGWCKRARDGAVTLADARVVTAP